MQNKVDENNFYVYLHRKKHSDKIFYVGKGKNNRHISKSGRNLHWKNTILKYKWYSIKVQCNLSEDDALELEEFLIQEIGLFNLCNKNYFNGGKSGFKHSEETKLNMSIYRKGKTPWNKGIKSVESSIRMLGSNNPMFGKKKIHSKETILKLQEKNGTEVCDLYTGIFYSSLNLMSNAINQGRKTTEFKKRACRV